MSLLIYKSLELAVNEQFIDLLLRNLIGFVVVLIVMVQVIVIANQTCIIIATKLGQYVATYLHIPRASCQ